MASILPGRVSYLVCAFACNHSCGDHRDWSCWWNDNSHPCQTTAGFPGGASTSDNSTPCSFISALRSLFIPLPLLGAGGSSCPSHNSVLCRVVHPTGHLFTRDKSNTTSEARLVVCQLLKTLRVWGSSWQFLLQAGQAVDGFGALALWPGRGQP